MIDAMSMRFGACCLRWRAPHERRPGTLPDTPLPRSPPVRKIRPTAPILAFAPKGESILDARPHRGPENQRLSLQTLSLPTEGTRAAGLRNRNFAAHGKHLPLNFPFAPAHHQHHQQKSCGEPKYGLHYHVTHIGGSPFLSLE